MAEFNRLLTRFERRLGPVQERGRQPRPRAQGAAEPARARRGRRTPTAPAARGGGRDGRPGRPGRQRPRGAPARRAHPPADRLGAAPREARRAHQPRQPLRPGARDRGARGAAAPGAPGARGRGAPWRWARASRCRTIARTCSSCSATCWTTPSSGRARSSWSRCAAPTGCWWRSRTTGPGWTPTSSSGWARAACAWTSRWPATAWGCRSWPEVVETYGGTLELGRSNRLGGFRAAVRLPSGMSGARAAVSPSAGR